MKISKKTLIASIIAISALVGAVYGATVLLTQDFPSVTIPPAAVSSLCGLTSSGHSALFLSNTPTPTSGILHFTCPGPVGNSAYPAFTAVAGSFIPALVGISSLPGPYTTINIVSVSALIGTSGYYTGNQGLCTATGITLIPVTLGTAMTLAAGGYDYCVQYSGAPAAGMTAPVFSISWSQ